MANRVRNAILRDGIRDSGCGAKGFRRACIEHIVPFNSTHRFLGAMMRSAGFRLVECPVRHHPRQHGVSKYGIGNRLWRGIYDLIGVGWLVRRYVVIRVEGEDSARFFNGAVPFPAGVRNTRRADFLWPVLSAVDCIGGEEAQRGAGGLLVYEWCRLVYAADIRHGDPLSQWNLQPRLQQRHLCAQPGAGVAGEGCADAPGGNCSSIARQG